MVLQWYWRLNIVSQVLSWKLEKLHEMYASAAGYVQCRGYVQTSKTELPTPFPCLEQHTIRLRSSVHRSLQPRVNGCEDVGWEGLERHLGSRFWVLLSYSDHKLLKKTSMQPQEDRITIEGNILNSL